MQQGTTGHQSVDTVADMAQHSYYSSQSCRGEHYSGAVQAHLRMLLKQVLNVWMCCAGGLNHFLLSLMSDKSSYSATSVSAVTV